jgi:Putative transposase
MPAVEFELSTLGSPQTIRTDGVTEWKYVFQPSPATDEFIRRFLLHVVPKGFHRIRHYGLLADGNRAANIAHARKLLAMPLKEPNIAKPQSPTNRLCCRVHARAAAAA